MSICTCLKKQKKETIEKLAKSLGFLCFLIWLVPEFRYLPRKAQPFDAYWRDLSWMKNLKEDICTYIRLLLQKPIYIKRPAITRITKIQCTRPCKLMKTSLFCVL